ncbi:MAG: ABC transporter ATP-binding protein [Clostridia bacterium]|nr:ABC transporter ATP-binding protein [Clostridia bacterium]
MPTAGEERRRVARENSRQIRLYEKAKKRKAIPASEYVTEMADAGNLIEFDDLHTFFFTDSGTVKAVDGVSFAIPLRSTVGVVGESGCGKSVTSLSLMRLVQGPAGQIVSGAIRYNRGTEAVDLTRLPLEEMQKIRGNEIAMIFQEPMTSLNPVFTIGDQIDEAITLHNPRLPKEETRNRSVEMLRTVGIARPEGVYKNYPHELSGGMRQRVMIAMALSCSPRLIIADEPTTALDVTIQAQILDLLRSLKGKVDASIMLITHDLGVVAEMADYVIVMYAGRVIETGTAHDIYLDPRHPYTVGLLNAKPQVHREVERLYSIPGQVPNPIGMPPCCYFRERCEKRFAKCEGDYPPMIRLSPTHQVACWLCEGGDR